jgi:HSP20 family protein
MEITYCSPLKQRWVSSWLDDPPWSMSDLDDFFSSTDREDIEHITPAADIIEEDGRFVIRMDLPAADRDSIKVQAHDGMLSVFAKKKNNESDANGCYCHQERRFGHFGRSFRLGEIKVEHEKIDAHYEDGVLTITIPKGEHNEAHQIPVTTH